MRVLILLRRSTINQEAADELRQRNWADISFSPGFNQVAAPCTSDPATVSTVFRENLSKTVETVNGGEKSPLSTRLKPGENDKEILCYTMTAIHSQRFGASKSHA